MITLHPRSMLARSSVVVLVLAAAIGMANAADRVAAPTGDIVALAFDPVGHRLFKASAHALYRSANDGQSWQSVSLPEAVQRGKITSIAVASKSSALLYVGGRGFGVLRSVDGGQSFHAIDEGLPAREVDALTAHAGQTRTLYAHLPSHGIYRSEDAGDHWRLMDAGPRQTIIQLVHSHMAGSMQTGWLFAATTKGVSRSMDCFCGWRDAGAVGRSVSRVAYDPQTPSTVYAVTADAILYSTNGGEQWTRATSPGSLVTALVVNNQGVVYAAVGGDVLRSADHGKTWLRVDG